MELASPGLGKPRISLHREVAELLAERIISGEFPAKSLFPAERELCATLNVSRTVVREAAKVLESRGLVRIERGRGTIVQEVQSGPLADSLKVLLQRGSHELENLLEVRKMLEVGIAGLAAQRRSEEQLEAMRQALETMRQNPSKPEGYVDADVAFHAEIARAAQNAVVGVLLQPLTDLLRESRMKSFSGPRMVRLRLRQHEEIFERIKARDSQGAQEAMARHLSDTEKDLARQQRRQTQERG